MCRFLDAGIRRCASCSGGRRPKSAKARTGAYLLKAGAGGAPPKQRFRSILWSGVAALVVVALIAAAWFGRHPLAPPPAPAPAPVSAVADEKLANAPRLSIVVLPFANLSGDPEQDYFADGITDDLTTDLSHLADSFVIAHNTALTYKGRAVDAKAIGRELGVRYALEGSVRRSDDAITINAQLVSTETGAHIWADRFEGERSKLGELQVEVVSSIANTLAVQLVRAEALRATRERPNNPDAVDLEMRGIAAYYKRYGVTNNSEALGYFERALGHPLIRMSGKALNHSGRCLKF